MDKIQLKFLNERGFTKDTVFSDGRYEALKQKLLEQGGEAVILTVDIDNIYKQLLNDGQFFNKVLLSAFACDNAFEGVKRFHNAFVGFQLDSDNLWRYSTWAMQNIDTAIETTSIAGTLYYGVKA